VRGASESAWPPRLRRLSVPVGGRRCDTGANSRTADTQSSSPCGYRGADGGSPPGGWARGV
jgi:hypothetical protein